ncbi:hypothetical protein ACFLUE_02925 [Chloroflexota bacterium]
MNLFRFLTPKATISDQEIARGLRLVETEEAESAVIAKRLEKLYLGLYAMDNLRTIPGRRRSYCPNIISNGRGSCWGRTSHQIRKPSD